MAKKRKPGKAQQRILDKYKNVIESLDIRRQIGDKSINQRNSLKQELKALARKSKALDNRILQAQLDGVDARPIIRQKHMNQNDIRQARTMKYKLDLNVRTAYGYIDVNDRRIPISYDDLTEEQQQIINRLERSLEEYTTGEMNITKFYHEYGFDQVDEMSLRIFAEGEGLI